MTDREQLKLAIDAIDDTYLEVLYRIILAFNPSPSPSTLADASNDSSAVNEIVTVEQNMSSPSGPISNDTLFIFSS